MSRRPCVIEGCGAPANSRQGWCSKHWSRWRRQGDPLLTVNRVGVTMEERIESQLYRAPSGHWIWLGKLNNWGYGIERDGVARKTILVHRFVYARYVGPLIDGLTIDHLCRTVRCAAPMHLDQVTQGENTRRARLAAAS